MDNTVKLGIANAVWYNEQVTVAGPFKSTIETYYDGRVEALNFKDPSAKDVINGWVENKTNDRIKNLVDEIEPDEVMLLVNAIYFKGDWTYKFSKTYDAPFYRADGSSVNSTMMYRDEADIVYLSNDLVELIDLPYGNEQFRFTVLLPEYHDTLDDLAASLDAATFADWLAVAHETTAELELPKFKMEWKKDLKQTLEEMGMITSGFPHLLDEADELAISRVIHQTFLDVNEKGTEAAAATAVGIYTTSLPSRITVNRPFIFMIREKHSNTVLFIGCLKNPA
jgi:serpin B